MLSHISFILAFALVVSGSHIIRGNWRYEGQFMVGNPKQNWDQVGWKLVVPETIILPQTGHPDSVMVKFLNPKFQTLNDRLPERTIWSQLNRMNWLETLLTYIQKPFAIRFNKNTVKEIITEKDDIKQSIDIKTAFAKSIANALHENMGKDEALHHKSDSEVRTVETIKGNHQNRTVVSIIAYHACEDFYAATVGIIPLKQHCMNCQCPKKKLPLESYTKVELVRDDKQVVSILCQNVVALPVFETDSPAYSLYGNTSLIRVASVPVNLPIEMKSAMVIPINRPGIQSSAKLFFLPQGVLKNAQEAMKLIRAILSEKGKTRKGENILALYDLLSSCERTIRVVAAMKKTKEERNVFYSFLTTQESHVALEILMNATLNKEIPLSAVPALMVLSSKVTDMTDHTQLHKFIRAMEKECYVCGIVSNLAMSIIMRRNMRNTTKATWMLSNETRLRLAMAGNAGINLMMMIPENDVTTKMAYVQSKRSVDKIYLQQVLEELIQIFASNSEATVVRAEAFKVIMERTCNRSVWAALFARMNTIDDPSLVSYVVSYLKSLASNKLPVNKFLAKNIQEQLPLLKVTEQPQSLLAQHITLSAYNRKSNMGFAVMGEYIIPKVQKYKYMKASLEIQYYILNTLVSLVKVQVLVPHKELESATETIKNINIAKDSYAANKIIQQAVHVVRKSDLAIFNNDMEILFITPKLLAGYLKSAITSIRSLIYSRGIIVPVAIKKQIYTHVGPHMEMSWVSYLASDTIYEVIADRSLKVTPSLSAGTRIKIQADDKVTINTGVLIKTDIETGPIVITLIEGNSGIRLLTTVSLRVPPVATLQVIPTTGSLMGTPKKNWEEQISSSTRTKSVSINLVAGLDDPSVVLNISGRIQKPLNQNWMYALQEPQFVQLSLLPTYQLPSDKIVIEWVYSKRRCLPTSKCIFAVDMRQRNIKTCLTGCINAVVDRGNMLGRGSILRIIEEDTHDTLNIEIDSRIKLLNNSQVGQFKLHTVLNYPQAITPQDLFDNKYLNVLKKHKFNSLVPMQMTVNETETTRQLKKIMSGITLPESRQEDYTDMNNDILILYPRLYIQDTLQVSGLHHIFKELLALSTQAIARRSQFYQPNWTALSTIKVELLELLKISLVSPQPEKVIMQDHVILWCVMKYFEVAQSYYEACGKCATGKTVTDQFKTTIFSQWKIFYTRCLNTVKDALEKSTNHQMTEFIQIIINTDRILINLIEASDSEMILNQYRQLSQNLDVIVGKMHQLSFKQQMLSKTVMVRLVGFELLKSIADHWQMENSSLQKPRVIQKTATTDLEISFMSVAGRFIIQTCNILSQEQNNQNNELRHFLSQAIALIDYKKYLRTIVIDNSYIAKLKLRTNTLVSETQATINTLKQLTTNITQDPMLRLLIIEVMTTLRITVEEMKRIPKFAHYPTTSIPVEEWEWDLIVLMKTLTANYRPLSTLKRGIMKEDEKQYMLRSKTPGMAEQGVRWRTSIDWPQFGVVANINAKKSDSQVMLELQQSTMTKSKSMVKSLNRILFNRTKTIDWLALELNLYRDISAMIDTKGTIPDNIKSTLAIAMEKIKVALLPFEVSLTQNDTTAIHTECQSDKCVRAVISKDNRKVDILWREPTENTLSLQVPIGL